MMVSRNMDVSRVLVTTGVALLAFSSLPLASAAKNCRAEEPGDEPCRDPFPLAAKIAIAVVSVTIVFLTLTLVLCVRRNRKAAAEADKDYVVEASQVTGPPTIVNATYTPETGHSVSRLYGIGTAESVALTPANVNFPPNTGHHGNTPAMPMPVPSARIPTAAGETQMSMAPGSAAVLTAPRIAIHAPLQPPQTAPAHKATFSNGGSSYPFVGFGSSNPGESPSAHASQPRSAFVSSGGFPRPLLAGRLKDRIRERPPSISSLNREEVPMSR